MEPLELLSGGGITAGIVGLVYAGRLLLDYRKHRHDEAHEDQHALTADSATANAILINTVETLQTENKRLVGRVEALEADNTEKDAIIDRLSENLRDMKVRIEGMESQLNRLKGEHR